MFKKKALKIYRKTVKFENRYGSEMADKVVFGRIWYKLFTQQIIRVIVIICKKSKGNRIVFDTKPDMSGNGKALFEYLLEHGYHKRYKITCLVTEPKEYREYKKHNVKFVKRIGTYHHFHTAKSYLAILRAKYVFYTKDFDWIDNKSKDQIYINLWHGCGFRDGTLEEKTLTKFDYCTVPGDLFIKAKAKFFSCSKKKILPIGDARYNYFKKNRQETTAFFEEISKGECEKKILWVPLQRNPTVQVKYKTAVASIMGLPLIHSVEDMRKLNDKCQEAGVMLIVYCNINMQTLCKETGNLSHIRFMTGEMLAESKVDLYELLPKFDGLLSDFSSVTFDYLLMNKPIGYILDEYEEYGMSGGFVFKEPKKYMPGEHIYDIKQLEEFLMLMASGEDNYQEARAEVRREAHNETEDYCRRILEQFSIR